MKKTITVLLFAAILAGCTATYTYDGQRYGSSAEFQTAVDAKLSEALATISPLATPLTNRKLILGFPKESVIYAENQRRHELLTGKPLIGIGIELNTNLSRAAFKNNYVFYDAIRKRNIYSDVQFVELDTMTASLAPSPDTDTFFYVEPSQGAGQWFYASAKQGKQVFAFDKTAPTLSLKLKNFIDAIQAMAIRE